MNIELAPIGWVRSTENGPREDYWGDVTSTISLDGHLFESEALEGLAEFSHIEVLFHMHGVPETAVETGARHPRDNPDWPKVGIFSQRAKRRPNRIGATICELLAIEELNLMVRGLDALNGSPVLDIKPVFAEFLPERGSLRQPPWSHEMMAKYFARGLRWPNDR